jgi:hypothetical protein
MIAQSKKTAYDMGIPTVNTLQFISLFFTVRLRAQALPHFLYFLVRRHLQYNNDCAQLNFVRTGLFSFSATISIKSKDEESTGGVQSAITIDFLNQAISTSTFTCTFLQKLRLCCTYRPSINDFPKSVVTQIVDKIARCGYNYDYIHFQRVSWNEIRMLYAGQKTWYTIFIDCLEVD